jgi:hypothetical protein
MRVRTRASFSSSSSSSSSRGAHSVFRHRLAMNRKLAGPTNFIRRIANQQSRTRTACPTKLLLDRLPLLFVSEVGTTRTKTKRLVSYVGRGRKVAKRRGLRRRARSLQRGRSLFDAVAARSVSIVWISTYRMVPRCCVGSDSRRSVAKRY